MLYPSPNKPIAHYLYRSDMSTKWERRDKKLAKRKKMKVDGKSVFIIEQELAKRGKNGQ